MKINVIWITGASSGIGRELALQYAKRQNTALILSSRRKQELEKVRKACGKSTSIVVLPFDLEVPDKAVQVVEQALTIFAHIDVLINNGGVSQRSLISEPTMKFLNV